MFGPRAALRRAGRVGGLIAATVGLACCGAQARPVHSDTPAASPAATPAAAPARDTFSGVVTRSVGRRTAAVATVTVALDPGSAGAGATRPITVTVHSACRRRRRCVVVSGTVTGTLTAAHGLPDVGVRSALRARGTIRPLGRVSATGTVIGTGNIRNGRESLALTLTGRSGRLMLRARSALVGSFTSP